MPRSREAGEKGVLPEFELVESYELDFEGVDIVMLELRCTRCKGSFIVEQERFVAPLMSVIKKDIEIKGRTCPYCMKVSEVPAEFVPERWHQSDGPLLKVSGKKRVPVEPEPVDDNAGYHGFEGRGKVRKVRVKRTR